MPWTLDEAPAVLQRQRPTPRSVFHAINGRLDAESREIAATAALPLASNQELSESTGGIDLANMKIDQKLRHKDDPQTYSC